MWPMTAELRENGATLVTNILIAFWTFVVIGLLISTLSSAGQGAVPEPILISTAAVLVSAVLVVIASSLRHLFSSNYRGSYRWLWFILILAGHIIGSTIYHIFVRLKGRKDSVLSRPSKGVRPHFSPDNTIPNLYSTAMNYRSIQ